MPYKDIAARQKVNAESMRRTRIFNAAVAAGVSKAVEAERERQRWLHPLKPADALWARLQALPKGSEERQRFKDQHIEEYQRLQREGAAINKVAARKRYLALRAEVIAEAEALR